MLYEIHQGDAAKVLRILPEASVHLVVTSPPYWGLRDYGVAGQIGLESTVEEWLEKLVDVFREVARVLRKDGTLWLNIGDCYNTNGQGPNGHRGGKDRGYPVYQKGRGRGRTKKLKPKDLMGIPWRLAFALQADGWWLRSEIIWSKPNPTPGSATDRPAVAHEHLFLLAQGERYFYDEAAVREPAVGGKSGNSARVHRGDHLGSGIPWEGSEERTLRTVWHFPTEAFPGHHATFPKRLVEPCIRAGTSERGSCLQCGAPLRRVLSPATGGSIGKSWHDHSQDFRKGNSKTTPTRGYRPGKTIGWKGTVLTTLLATIPTGPHRLQVRTISTTGLFSVWSPPLDVTVTTTPPASPTGLKVVP